MEERRGGGGGKVRRDRRRVEWEEREGNEGDRWREEEEREVVH